MKYICKKSSNKKCLLFRCRHAVVIMQILNWTNQCSLFTTVRHIFETSEDDHPPLDTHARDHWWTSDSANAFVFPGVNSWTELVPSHVVGLGDNYTYFNRTLELIIKYMFQVILEFNVTHTHRSQVALAAVTVQHSSWHHCLHCEQVIQSSPGIDFDQSSPQSDTFFSLYHWLGALMHPLVGSCSFSYWQFFLLHCRDGKTDLILIPVCTLSFAYIVPDYPK
jgi:hypothetical protein